MWNLWRVFPHHYRNFDLLARIQDEDEYSKHGLQSLQFIIIKDLAFKVTRHQHSLNETLPGGWFTLRAGNRCQLKFCFRAIEFFLRT
jgi:hypothetical protein